MKIEGVRIDQQCHELSENVYRYIPKSYQVMLSNMYPFEK